MSVIRASRTLDTGNVAEKIKVWFDTRNFETRLFEENGSHYLKARKSSWWRAVLAADRALQIGVHNDDDGQTYVEVKQGDWTTNIVSNAVWLVVTGGSNLLISGWSFALQKQVERHIRDVLEQSQMLFRKVEIDETEMSEELAGEEKRRADNLKSTVPLSQEFCVSRDWRQSLSISFEQAPTCSKETGVAIGTEFGISASDRTAIREAVRSSYSLSSDTRQTYSERLSYPVPPGKEMLLTIRWKRIWQHGVIRSWTDQDTALEVPFRAVVGMRFEPSVEVRDAG